MRLSSRYKNEKYCNQRSRSPLLDFLLLIRRKGQLMECMIANKIEYRSHDQDLWSRKPEEREKLLGIAFPFSFFLADIFLWLPQYVRKTWSWKCKLAAGNTLVFNGKENTEVEMKIKSMDRGNICSFYEKKTVLEGWVSGSLNIDYEITWNFIFYE